MLALAAALTASVASGCTRAGAVASEAGATDATAIGPVAPPPRWSLVRTDAGLICASAEKEPTFCFSPAEEIAGRHVRDHIGARFPQNPYRWGDGGLVTVSHGETEEALWREKLVAKLPPVTKIVHELMSSCALTMKGDVLCWPEAAFAHELPHPIDVGEPVADLFLQSWMTLCVRTVSRRILCSPAHPTALDICAIGVGAPCGTAVAAHAPPQLGERLGPVRTSIASLLPKALDAIASDADDLAAFTHAPHYEQLDGNLFVRDTAPGGCVRRGHDLSCFRRSGCHRGRPWTLETVPGMPSTLRKVHLGAEHGYALSEDGALFAFDRGPAEVADGPCAVLHADAGAGAAIHSARVPLRAPVHDVTGGLVWAAAVPGHASADCASLVDGSIWCWISDRPELGEPKRIDPPVVGKDDDAGLR